MLITCSECNQKISDKAVFCVHCGNPIRKTSSVKIRRTRHKLPNGFGQITKISGKHMNNPYRAMVTVGHDAYGKPIVKLLKPRAYFESYNEAYEALLKYNKANLNLDKASMTLSDLFNEWIKIAEDKPKISKKLIASYYWAWGYCKEIYGKLVISFKSGDAKKFITSHRNDMPKSLFNLYAVIMNLMFDYAVEIGVIDANPMRASKLLDRIDVPKKIHHKTIDDADMQIYLNSLDNIYVEILVVQSLTGMRPSEVLEIRTENVNIKDWYIVGGMKTEAGRNRTIPIHKRLRNIIEIRYRNAIELGFEYLYQSKRKRPMSYDSYRNGLIRASERLQISKQYSPHDARVYFVSVAKKYNVDEYAIKRIVGHSISDLTERVYTDRSLEWLHNELDKIP